MLHNPIIVAIDGYSSCGKSTIAKALAKYAGYTYVDTGAMYRCISLYMIRNKISKDDKTSGIKSCGEGLARQLIKNTYKTLLTRGQKGCYIYCEDKALADYLKARINRTSEFTYSFEEN